MSLENYPMETSLPHNDQGGLRCVEIHAIDHTSYPLTVVASAGKTLQFRIGYDSECFERASIERLFGHMQTLLMGLATSDPECRQRDLPMLDAAEHRELLDWSRAQQTASTAHTLPELFEAAVARGPDKIAVVCDGACLTYRELSRKARVLANRLRRHGARPDQMSVCWCTGLPIWWSASWASSSLVRHICLWTQVCLPLVWPSCWRTPAPSRSSRNGILRRNYPKALIVCSLMRWICRTRRLPMTSWASPLSRTTSRM